MEQLIQYMKDHNEDIDDVEAFAYALVYRYHVRQEPPKKIMEALLDMVSFDAVDEAVDMIVGIDTSKLDDRWTTFCNSIIED